MADEPASLKRAGTMVVTSEEGQAFLEKEGFKSGDDDAKTRAQKDHSSSPPKVARQTTMLATAKEGERFVGDGGHGRTRAQTRARLSSGKDSDEKEKVPSMKRAGTMAATAQEGLAFLEREGHSGVSEGKTRAAAPAADEPEEDPEVSEPEPMEPSSTSENGTPGLKRASTMAVTAKEGQAFLESQGGEATSRTRQADDESEVTSTEVTSSDDSVAALKRTSTMAATAQEAHTLLGMSAPEGATRAESAALQAAKDQSERKRSHEGDEDEDGDAKRSKETEV